MVDPVYQLNSDNWILFYSETRSRPETFPLPAKNWKFSPGLQSEADLLAVFCSTPSGADEWLFGGFLNISFPTGLSEGGVTDARSNQIRKLRLKEIRLFPVQKFSSSYALEFSIPYWLPDILIKVWEYSGSVTYPEIELLQEINAKV